MMHGALIALIVLVVVMAAHALLVDLRRDSARGSPARPDQCHRAADRHARRGRSCSMDHRLDQVICGEVAADEAVKV